MSNIIYYSHPAYDPSLEKWDTFLNQTDKIVSPFRSSTGRWMVTTPRGLRRSILAYDISELFWKVLSELEPTSNFGVEITTEADAIVFHVASDGGEYFTYRVEPTHLTNDKALSTLYVRNGGIMDIQPANYRTFTKQELIHLVGGPYDEIPAGRQTIIAPARSLCEYPLNPAATAHAHDLGKAVALHGDILFADQKLLENDNPLPRQWMPGLYLTAEKRYVRLIGKQNRQWLATTIHNDLGKFRPGKDHLLPTHLTWSIVTDPQTIVALAQSMHAQQQCTFSRLPPKRGLSQPTPVRKPSGQEHDGQSN